MSSNVASFEHPTEAVTVDDDHHHRKLIPEKDGVLTPSECESFVLSFLNYGFKVTIMRPEKLRFFLLGVSTVSPDKTLALYTKPITIRNNDIAMPVLLEVCMGRKEFIEEASENGQSVTPLEWLTVHGNGMNMQMDAVSNLTKPIIDLETKKEVCPEAAQVVEVETQKIVVIGATELQSEVMNALSRTGKATAHFMSKFSVDYEMVISNQLYRAVDNTKGESIFIPTISTVILPASQLKDADQTPRPYENPDDDGVDCGCCAMMQVISSTTSNISNWLLITGNDL